MKDIEATLSLDGGAQTFTIRPEFKTFLAIERGTGKTLVKLIEALSDVSLMTMAETIFYALAANGYKKITLDEIGNYVMKNQAEALELITNLINSINKSGEKGTDTGKQ